MPLESTGSISLGGSTTGRSVNLELSRSATAQISLGESAVRTLASVASGQISLSSLYGKSSVQPGQQLYTTPGSYTFTVPSGVTSISVCAIGGGGGAAGGGSGVGGGLAYKNNIAVTPGTNYLVTVGSGGVASLSGAGFANDSLFQTSGGASTLVLARGGFRTTVQVGDVSYLGGNQGSNLQGPAAAGYSSNGASDDPSSQWGSNGKPGAGGSGGSGGAGSVYVNGFCSAYFSPGGGGGGTGILGIGSNGTAGTGGTYGSAAAGGGGGGSGGTAGTSASGPYLNATGGNGGLYGGGGGGGGFLTYYISPEECGEEPQATGGSGGGGAVRIIWGSGRSYPSNAANV